MLSKAEPVSFKISKMEVSPENQISNQNQIKVENPEWKALRKNQSPTSSLKIPNLKNEG